MEKPEKTGGYDGAGDTGGGLPVGGMGNVAPPPSAGNGGGPTAPQMPGSDLGEGREGA